MDSGVLAGNGKVPQIERGARTARGCVIFDENRVVSTFLNELKTSFLSGRVVSQRGYPFFMGVRSLIVAPLR